MKKLYHIYDPITFFIIYAVLLEEGTQPSNAIFQENVNFIKPKFDTTTNLIVEGATQVEIDAFNAVKNDELDDAYVLSLEEAGLQVVRRHRKRLRRRVEESTTSFDDAKTVRKLLRPIWQELKDGDFDWALTDAQAIDQTLYNNAVDRETNWIITRIQELIVSNPLAKLK